ncbi:MAG: hypothetical protein MN733_07300 [Nitrososphaera sp.]|nr:hypothetical protein [Nitrososphaera sp.]
MKANSIVCIAGMRGEGKSTFLRRILANLNRVLIIDTLAEHSDYKTVSQEEYIKAARSGPFRLRTLIPPQSDEQQQAFETFAKLTFALAQESASRITLAIEEVDWYSHPSAENPGLNLLIQYGRHGPVDLLYTTRSLVSISRKLTSETDCYILFRQQEPRWLDALADRVGDDVAQEVELLQRYHYVKVTQNVWSIHST